MPEIACVFCARPLLTLASGIRSNKSFAVWVVPYIQTAPTAHHGHELDSDWPCPWVKFWRCYAGGNHDGEDRIEAEINASLAEQHEQWLRENDDLAANSDAEDEDFDICCPI
jgi:hypothetical protein